MKQRMKVPYEKGVAIRSASSLALGIARHTAKRRQRIGGVAPEAGSDWLLISLGGIKLVVQGAG
jgi:hypothetical protein